MSKLYPEIGFAASSFLNNLLNCKKTECIDINNLDISSDYKGSRNQTGISFRFETAFIDHVSWIDNAPYLPKTRRTFNLDWSHNIAFGKNLYLKLQILNLFKTRNYGVYYNWLNTNTLDYTSQIERIFSFGLKYRLN